MAGRVGGRPGLGRELVLNSLQGFVVANAAIVPAGSDGGIQVKAANATDLIIDVNGYFVDNTAKLTLPFSGYSFNNSSAFSVTNGSPGFSPDPTKSYAAIVGNGGTSYSSYGSNAGNAGVQGLGGNGNSGITYSPSGAGGAGVLASGGTAGDTAGSPGGGGGPGVYATGGISGYGSFGYVGGPGIQALGGTGGTACAVSSMTGECEPTASGGGQGGTGLIATGGAGGPGGPSGVGIFAFPGAAGAGGDKLQHSGIL